MRFIQVFGLLPLVGLCQRKLKTIDIGGGLSTRYIGREKKRIGGDFAVAHVILTKEIRDKMREWLGPDLIFVELEMSQEDRRARVMDRHMGEAHAADLMDVNI